MDEISLLQPDKLMTGTHTHLFETAIGTCGIAWTERGIAQLQLPEKDRAATEHRLQKRAPGAVPSDPPPAIAEAVREIQLYATGTRTDFASVPLDLEGRDAFSRTIYDLLRTVGWGQTTTYGELARRAGSGPEAARTVGQAMGSNRIPIIIPCHRVLASGQKIGGFSAPGGTLTKERLLALEGVVPDAPLLPMFSEKESRWG